MSIRRRLLVISAATGALVVVVAACGEEYANPISSLPPIASTTTTTAVPTVPELREFYYEIQSGEGLNMVSQRYCVPLDVVKEMNKEKFPDPNLIPEGAMIKLPTLARVANCEPTATFPPAG